MFVKSLNARLEEIKFVRIFISRRAGTRGTDTRVAGLPGRTGGRPLPTPLPAFPGGSGRRNRRQLARSRKTANHGVGEPI